MLAYTSKMGKKYIYYPDYLLIKFKKAFDYEKTSSSHGSEISIEKEKSKYIFSTYYSNYGACNDIQGQIQLTSSGEEMQSMLDLEQFNKNQVLISYFTNLNNQMEVFQAKDNHFLVNKLLNFKIAKEVGFYKAFDFSEETTKNKFDWKGCEYASWAAKIEFKQVDKLRFKVFKTGYDIEIGMMSDSQNGLKIESHVVVVSTLINGEKEMDEKSEINKYKPLKASERKYVHFGYKKLEGENGGSSDIRVNLKGEVYLLLSFWVKHDDSDFKEVYEEICHPAKNHESQSELPNHKKFMRGNAISSK